ncbi:MULTISPECIES: RHS repeat-associated core domain-containing protein [unclassified Chryseobacterium]|uniref:RHS repeat-associated core domain-containing protein n=1 Tax=unclassified Chryseobacterium TaxID=2593645 RepID=UPI00301829CF
MKHEGYNQTTGNPSYNYQYSGKELQKETGWSDFGARMYMSDIARWGVIDPLAETTTRVNPYNYALNNPVMFIDPDGRKAFAPEPVEDNVPRGGLADFYLRGGNGSYASYNEFLGKDMLIFYKGANGAYGGGGGSGPTEIGIYGKFAQAAFDLLKESMKGQLNLTFKDGMVSGSAVEGATLSEAASWLLEAIKNPDIKVRLDTVAGFYFYDPNLKKDVYFEGDAFRGSFIYNNKTVATNIVSTEVIKGFDFITKSPNGTGVLHAALEAYIGGKYFPDSMKTAGKDGTFGPDNIPYSASHDWAACLDKENFRNTPANYRLMPNEVRLNGKLQSISPYFYNKTTGEILYRFGTVKY